MKKPYKIAVAGLLSLLAFGGIARAQETNNSAINNQTVASQNNQDNRQLAEQITALEFGDKARDEAKKAASDPVIQMLEPSILQDNPGQDQKIQTIIQQTVVPIMASSIDDMVKQMVDSYAQNFSSDELRQLLVFYKSPLGEKYLKIKAENANKIKMDSLKSGFIKMNDAIHALVEQLKLNNLNVPKHISN